MRIKAATPEAYSEQLPDFARPVLAHFRALVAEECPRAEEKIKWGHLSFEYKGMMCGFAAFKNYCAIVFWKGVLIAGSENIMQQTGRSDMSKLDKITSVADLPSDRILRSYLREALRLNEENIKLPAAPKAPRKEAIAPADLLKTLKKNKAAAAVFESFSPSNKRDYIEWIEDAKTQATREKRLATALEWMAEGKVRNWKYIKK